MQNARPPHTSPTLIKWSAEVQPGNVICSTSKGKMAEINKTRLVILIELFWTRDKDPRTPLGHASLRAALHALNEVEVSSLVRPVNLAPLFAGELADEVMARVGDRAHDEVDVAIGVYVWSENLIQALLPALRVRGFKGRIILGGPQVSYVDGGLEALYPDADIFIRGYGEEALCAVVKSSTIHAIPGVHVAGTLDACTRASADFETLPSPWLTGLIPLTGQRFVRWETQRGCPFRCAFCQHREPGARLKRRKFGIERVMAEVDLFCASDVDDIAVLDPIFDLNPYAVTILQRFIAGGFKGRLSLQCRAESLTSEFLNAAAQLNVCLELGLQTIHDDEGRAIDRKNKIEKVDKALAEIRARQIDHEVTLIFGLPLQTLSSFRASVSWCIERRVPVIKAFPLMLLRGTPLERDRERWGLRERGEEMPIVVASSSFDEEDWYQMAQISEALRLTEGWHPADIRWLAAMAEGMVPSIARWMPRPAKKDVA